MDQENTDVDVAEVPASTAAQESGADTQIPDNTGKAGDDTQEGGETAGFSSLFGAAAAKATATDTAADTEGSTDDEDDETVDESKKPADEKVPAKDDKTDEEDPSKKPAEADETGETKKPESGRTRNYKEVIQENETLRTERDTATQKVQQLDEKLEKYGGFEAVAEAVEILDKLATGKVDEVIADLPAHQRAHVQKTIFESAITEEANRVYGVNHVLKTDFGLEKDIPQGLMEKAFEFLAYRINTDGEDFESFLDRELEFANTPERELARTKAELERLKNPPADDKKADKPVETEDQLAVRVQTTHDEFESGTFKKIADAEFTAYGLTPVSTDTPGIKEAKELLRDAIFAQVGMDMRTSKAFEPLLPFWMSPDQTDQEKLYFRQAAGAYERAMKAKVQTALKKVSKLFTAKAPKTPDTKPGGQPQVPAAGQNGSNIQPPAKKPGADGGGFSSAFSKAKNDAGVDR